MDARELRDASGLTGLRDVVCEQSECMELPLKGVPGFLAKVGSPVSEERVLVFSDVDSRGVELASTIMLEVGMLGLESKDMVCVRVLTGDRVLFGERVLFEVRVTSEDRVFAGARVLPIVKVKDEES